MRCLSMTIRTGAPGDLLAGVRAGGGAAAVGVRLVIGWLLRGRALRIVEAVWCWWNWPAEKNREIWLSDRLHRMLVTAWANR